MNVLVYTTHLQTEQPISISDVINVSIDQRESVLTVECERDDNDGHIYEGVHRFHAAAWTRYEVTQ